MIWEYIIYRKKGSLVFILKDRQFRVNYIDLVLNGPLLDFYIVLYKKRGVIKVIKDKTLTHTSKMAQNFRNINFLKLLSHLL